MRLFGRRSGLRRGHGRLRRADGGLIGAHGGLLRLRLGGGVLVLFLERHVVHHVLVDAQQVVEGHAVQLRERDEIPRIGRRLGALPLRHRLPRQAKPFGQLLLAVSLLASHGC